MASATPRKVTLTARPGSILYQLQLQFNALVLWADTHVHAGAMTNPPTPLARASVKKLAERGGGPHYAVLTGDGTNLIEVTTVEAGMLASVAEFPLILRLWSEFNRVRDVMDGHTHAGTGVAPTQKIDAAVADMNGKGADGLNAPAEPVVHRAQTYDVGPYAEESDVGALWKEWNDFVVWYDAHAHGAVGGVPTGGLPTVSKISGPDGRDLTGALVTA